MIEVPMLETLASFWLTEHLFGATWTPERGSMGYDRIINKYRYPFPTKDGYVCGAALIPTRTWATFFDIARAARPREGSALLLTGWWSGPSTPAQLYQALDLADEASHYRRMARGFLTSG